MQTVGADWTVDSRDQAWDATVDEIAAWRAQHGRWPRRVSDSVDERRLYRWLTNRRREARGLGSGAAKFARDSRAALLDARLPGWRSETNDARWVGQAAALAAFVTDRGSLPRDTGRDDPESNLARWLAVQRTALDGRNDTIRAREAHLDTIAPGWRVPGLDEWAATLDKLCAFIADHGRPPRRYCNDPAETALYGWLARQREHRARGSALFAAQRRGEQLDDRLPGWDDTGRRRAAA